MTLYLKKMGMDFVRNDTTVLNSDCENYRIETRQERVKGKDGRDYFLSFGLYSRWHWRTTSLRGGKPLKHPVEQIDDVCALWIDTEYEDENGAWRNLSLETSIREMNLHYTKEDILKAVNSFSAGVYDRVIITD